ncbi:unnamed protein product, partial [Vitis vinifera]|uniref:Uncharacterized protein n=1 Tax=Vitis vinifera TaxID=29760 RepID=D7SZV5_VITVI
MKGKFSVPLPPVEEPSEDELGISAEASCCEWSCAFISFACLSFSIELNKLMKKPFGISSLVPRLIDIKHLS